MPGRPRQAITCASGNELARFQSWQMAESGMTAFEMETVENCPAGMCQKLTIPDGDVQGGEADAENRSFSPLSATRTGGRAACADAYRRRREAMRDKWRVLTRNPRASLWSSM